MERVASTVSGVKRPGLKAATAALIVVVLGALSQGTSQGAPCMTHRDAVALQRTADTSHQAHLDAIDDVRVAQRKAQRAKVIAGVAVVAAADCVVMVGPLACGPLIASAAGLTVAYENALDDVDRAVRREAAAERRSQADGSALVRWAERHCAPPDWRYRP